MNINPLTAPKKSTLPDTNIDIPLSTSKSSRLKNKDGKKFPIYLILIIALLIAIGAAGYFFFQYSQLKPKVDNPNQALEEQSKAIKSSVGKLFDLGNPDEYSVASINNVDVLRKENPTFFKNAKTGDFIVRSQDKVIVYDKDRNLILNVAPIINNTSQDTGSPNPTNAPAATNTPVPTATPEPTKKK